MKNLDLQRVMIVDWVDRSRTDLALDLMWRFMGLSEPVLNRIDDSDGSVGDVLRAACGDLGKLAAKAKPDPVDLSGRVFAAVQTDDYGVFDGLMTTTLPALGGTDAAHLKGRLGKALADRSGEAGERDYRALAVGSALQALADDQSDTAAYIALVPPAERRIPYQGAEIGRLLLAAGRAAEALAAAERARPKRSAAAAARDDDLHLLGLAADNEWEGT